MSAPIRGGQSAAAAAVAAAAAPQGPAVKATAILRRISPAACRQGSLLLNTNWTSAVSFLVHAYGETLQLQDASQVQGAEAMLRCISPVACRLGCMLPAAAGVVLP